MPIIIPSLPYNLTNGTVADANQVMADFNAVLTGVNTNAAHTGANGDITSLTGLTTPLSVGQGGTGQTALGVAGQKLVSNAGATNWVYDSAGVSDGSNAAAGNVGEFVQASGGPGGPASTVITNITQVSLTAGDWEVWGLITFASGAGNPTALLAGVSGANNTMPSPAGLSFTSGIISVATAVPASRLRFSLAAGATIFLNTQVNFASGSPQISGSIYARRMR